MTSVYQKVFIVILLFFFLVAQLTAQVYRTNFKGVVVDETDAPIPGATVMVLNAADSVLVQFGSSNSVGAFYLKSVPKGNYLCNITFLGYAPVYLPAISGEVEEIDLGRIKMETAAKLLSEVQVKADIIPIDVKKDTITYNADAFQVQPNANVEDLLKKMPGIEVNPDGSVKAQGEDVNRILVDGKEFFGTDPKMATKNLPAKSIKKVKVYDKQSDMSEFTGVDDGEREKTIDLQLKEEFKQGLFGTAEAGYGSDEKYNAKAAINRFSKTSQLSFLGQLNNINDQGFSFSDIMNFTGRSMSGPGGGGGGGGRNQFRSNSDAPFSDGLSNGLVNTGAGGINFNWHKTKKFNIRSSYFYNSVDKFLLQDVYRQNFSENPFDTYEDKKQDTENRSHRFSLDSDIKPDSTQQIKLNARLRLSNGNALNESFLQNQIPGGYIESESLSNTDDENENLSLTAGATYMKRLGSKGRNISLGGTLTKGEDKPESKLDALTQYFSTGESQELDQLQFTDSRTTRLEGQFSYTEPLKQRKFLEFNYAYSQQQDKYNYEVSDIIDSLPEFNEQLSNDYTSLFRYHKPGVTFRYSGDIHNVNIGLQYQISDLNGHLNQNENEITKDYKHFLPRAIWRNDMGNGKNLRISYTTWVNQPTITQLSPIVDNSDPLRLYVGNPNLNAEYTHNLNATYHSFTQFSSISFFVSLNGSYTEDRIINSRIIDEQFREVTLPVNINQESKGSIYTSFGRPFKPIHSRFNINLNASLTKTQNLIDNELTDLNRWSRTAGLTITNMNSMVLEYNFGGSWTFTDSYYKTSDALDQNTILHKYFIDATLTLWKKWKIGGGYTYNLYTSNEFGEDQSQPLMKLSLSRFILPNDRGQIKFSVFDVLDENRGLSRTEDINYIEEIRSNSIGRYAMLSFIYSIKGANSGQQMEVQMMGPKH